MGAGGWVGLREELGGTRGLTVLLWTGLSVLSQKSAIWKLLEGTSPT